MSRTPSKRSLVSRRSAGRKALEAVLEEADAFAQDELAKRRLEDWVEDARRDYLDFYRRVIGDMIGRELAALPAHLEEAAAHIEETLAAGLDCVWLGPYGHAKTTLCLAKMAREIGRHPNMRTQVISRKDPIALRRVKTVKSIIERSPTFRACYPDVQKGSIWGAAAFEVTRPEILTDPTMSGHGVLATEVGSRADLQLFEDPIDISSLSPAIRKSTEDAVFEVWLQRREGYGAHTVYRSGGRFLYAGTVYHLKDLAHVLLETSGVGVLVQVIAPDRRGIQSIRYVNPRASDQKPDLAEAA